MTQTSLSAKHFLLAGLWLACTAASYSQTLLWDSTGVPVCTAEGWQRAPRIGTDGQGGAIIAWEDLRQGSQAAIYAAKILPNGSLPWNPDGVVISPPAAGQRLAGLLPDGSGGAFLAWWNDAAGNSDVYAQRIGANGAALWSGGPLRVCNAPGNQQWVEMTADGEGGIIIAWHDKRGQDLDIYAQRVGASGNFLWQQNGVVISTAAGDQSYPQLASNRHGGAYIAWMDRRNEDDIYMQHVGADGTLRWTADLPVCTEPNRQIAPKVGQFGNDRVVVFWQDFRLGLSTSALYLQIFDEDGNKTYLEDYQVAQSEQTQSGMALSDDGKGGSLAVWADFRKSNADGDIYMRRINVDGSIIGDFGNAVCDAAGTQERPQMINDGYGGGLVVWQDKRNTFDYDLYMNRVSAQGTTNYNEWNTHSGVLLHRHDNNQLTPQIVASTLGTAIIVWYDGRILDGQADIYAQRVAWAPNLHRPDSVNFAMFKTGMIEYDTITLRNNGALPLVITNVRRASDPATTHPADFVWLPTIPLPYTLPPDSSVQLVVSFKPGGVGRRISELRISSNAPEDPAIIPLIGYGTNPTLETPSVYQMTVTKPGKSREEELKDFLTNKGSGTLYIHRLEFSGRDSLLFSLGANPPYPIAVPENGTASLRLRFSPDSAGPKETTLKIYHNADTLPRNVRISGIAATPVLLTHPITQYFDTTEATKSREAVIQIRNTTGVELEVYDIRLSGENPDDFSLQAQLPLYVPGGGALPFTLRFHPQSAGAKRADVIITSDAPSSPDILRVYGPAVPLSVPGFEMPNDFAFASLYPNPATTGQDVHVLLRLPSVPQGEITLRAVDLLGREVLVLHRDAGEMPGNGESRYAVTLPLRWTGLPAGVYTIIAEYRRGGLLHRHARPLLLLP
ncbi:MAG: choice-of-anchor D domain-containing protein [Bacteroidia bacterium]|nr:choice-of-anchor D domain-containing protein [Bacteroidia bacterium]